MARVKILAISGSARATSTNTALLRAMSELCPPNVAIDVIGDLDDLPVFSPDKEGNETPAIMRRFVDRIAQADGIIISSPEYVRAIPGGLKNAIDWLVSGETIIDKPAAIIHASQRGDDMLTSLRLVLGTVTGAFQADVFLRLPLISKTPDEVRDLARTKYNGPLQAYINAFAERIRHCQTNAGTAHADPLSSIGAP